MPTQVFDVHGVRVKASVDSAPIAQRLRAILGPFETDGSPTCDFAIAIHHATDAFADQVPPGMKEHWRGPLPDGTPAVGYRDASTREILLPGLARLRLTPHEADIRVAPDADWCLNLGCILPALCAFLARRGHHVIHAATLSQHTGDTPRALLLCGDSGRGKTTTALALAHAGMQLLTDDATFLHTSPDATDALEVWGLPRPCKVHRHTVELMPWLRAHCHGAPTADDEHMVELAALAGSGALELAEPAALLFLKPRNPHAHRLEPIDKVQAISRLANANLRAPDPRAQGPAGDAFRALTTLVRHTSTHLLSVGPNLHSLAHTLRPLLLAHAE